MTSGLNDYGICTEKIRQFRAGLADVCLAKVEPISIRKDLKYWYDDLARCFASSRQ